MSLPPKESVARSTPIAIVRTSIPSLKSKSAMPIDGPKICSGPMVKGLDELAAPGAEASSVNFCLRPWTFWAFATVANEPPMNSTVTSPAPKSSTPLCESLSFR